MVEKETKEKPMGKGLGIASMVCGIVALALCWTIYIGIVCGIVALVLGIVALAKEAEGKGMSIAGVITGAVGLVISAAILIFTVISANKIIDTITESVINDESWSELEDWSNGIKECLESNGINSDLEYEDMTEEQQDIYWDCL